MASSSGAVAFGANVDEDIARTWKQVEDRVIQMAGGDRSKLKQGLGIEKVLQYLDDAQAKEAKSSEKYGTVKNIFNRTLQCIQTVGGIVADGASYVCVLDLPSSSVVQQSGVLRRSLSVVPRLQVLMQCKT